MLSKFRSLVNYCIEQKWFIISLIFINLFGSIYGFMVYKEQLVDSSLRLFVFIPDGPIAAALFAIFLIFYLFNQRVPFVEVLAALASFKYGLWTIMIIIWGAWAEEPSIINLITLETISWNELFLILVHILMALQALIFYRKYSFGFWYILFAGIWLLTNDLLDYSLNIHPVLPDSISSSNYSVGKFTFYLSGFTLLLFYFLSLLRRKHE